MQFFIFGLLSGLVTFFLFGEIVGIRTTYLNKFKFSFIENLWFTTFMGLSYLYMGVIYGVILGILNLIISIFFEVSIINIILGNISFGMAILAYFFVKWIISKREWFQIISAVLFLGLFFIFLQTTHEVIVKNATSFWLLSLFIPPLFWSLINIKMSKKEGERVYSKSSKEISAYDVDSKVVFIGLDGCDWKILNKFLNQGKLPNLERIIDKGVYTKLKTVSPTDSPLIWNSIFTGKAPEQHGILNWHKTKFPFIKPIVKKGKIKYPEDARTSKTVRWLRKRGVIKRILFTTNDRKSKAFWNILSDYKKTSINIGWIFSWPAEKIEGIQVSWYLYPFEEAVKSQKKFKSSKVSRRVYPEYLQEELEDCIVRTEDLKEKELKKFHFPTGKFDYTKKYADKLKPWDYAKDKTFLNVAHYLLDKKKNFDFFSLFLYGMDAVSHSYWPFYEGATNNEKYKNEVLSVSDSEKFQKETENFDKCIPKYYEYIDRKIGKLLNKVEDDCNIIIISDHGFNFDSTEHGHGNAPEGIFIAKGPDIKSNLKIEKEITIYDVLPTLLALSGIPISRKLEGRVINEILSGEFLEKYPPKYVDNYGKRENKIKEELNKGTEKGLKERLRALGYIE